VLSDLAQTPVSETLRKLSAQRASGDLQIRSGKAVKTVFFDHGRIVFAASNLKKDRLGEALVSLGRITDEQFEAASALVRADRKRRFGDALVQTGVLDKGELGRSVARQVNHIVVSLFGLTEGVAAFEERPSAIPLEYMVSLSLHRLLYDGIRTMKSPELVSTGLGDLDRRVTLAEVPPFSFDPREAPADEVDILEHAKRGATLRRLAWQPGGLALPRLRAVYALLAGGILQETAGVLKVAALFEPVVQMETGTFLLSALQRRPDPTGRQAVRQEVDAELDRSARLDRETWLKVSRTAPREELVRALEEKMERYHSLLDAAGDDESLKTDLEVILGRASAMLRLARQGPEPAAEPGAATATAAPAVSGEAANGPATSPPPDDAPAATPAEPARAAAAPAAGVASPGASSFSGNAQVEHLLMEGEVRMTVSDYLNAAKVYARLVSIQPNVPAHRMRLAIALASSPRTAKQAEREFLEALRLEPDNADMHYQFGLYYKVMKQRARALGEMQTAVRLNPRHRLAREELEILAPRDNALLNLKKLFK
jgi:tetratricopeptide (TPR) repeat protein